MEQITTEFGTQINWNYVSMFFNEDVMNELNINDYDTKQDLYNAYCDMHRTIFGDEFFINDTSVKFCY